MHGSRDARIATLLAREQESQRAFEEASVRIAALEKAAASLEREKQKEQAARKEEAATASEEKAAAAEHVLALEQESQRALEEASVRIAALEKAAASLEREKQKACLPTCRALIMKITATTRTLEATGWGGGRGGGRQAAQGGGRSGGGEGGDDGVVEEGAQGRLKWEAWEGRHSIQYSVIFQPR